MRFTRLNHIFSRLLIVAGACWAGSMSALFGGKTELELNGLGVVKESAEILAKSIQTFPTRRMIIAIIGFIAVAQGLFFFLKGLASCICGDIYRPDGRRAGRIHGLIECLIGIGFVVLGSIIALFSTKIVMYLFYK